MIEISHDKYYIVAFNFDKFKHILSMSIKYEHSQLLILLINVYFSFLCNEYTNKIMTFINFNQRYLMLQFVINKPIFTQLLLNMCSKITKQKKQKKQKINQSESMLEMCVIRGNMQVTYLLSDVTNVDFINDLQKCANVVEK